MDEQAINIGNLSLALSCLLVLVSLFLLWLERLDISKEIMYSAVRSFLQLIIVGYLIKIIFGLEHWWWMFLLILVMITAGAQAAKQRAGKVRHPWFLCISSLLATTTLTLASVYLFGIVELVPRHFIPMAGIIIGNATKRLSTTLDRLSGEVENRRPEIEMALSLGASPRQAIEPGLWASVKAALIPTIDGMKIIGLVQMPGAMLGMLLAGAEPLQAVKLQIVVLYLILFAGTIVSLIAVEIGYRSYFNKAMQLVG